MSIASPTIAITNTFTRVREFSFEEKKSPLIDEERVNQFLDAINSFKDFLNAKSKKIYEINEGIESLTWINDINDDSLLLMNDLISQAKDLRSTLIRLYISIKPIQLKGISKEEIKDFKNAIDELKEAYEDLESVYFYLPKMPEFVETTKQLSLV